MRNYLKVMTWNIRVMSGQESMLPFKKLSWCKRLKRITEAIKEESPDVIFFQETANFLQSMTLSQSLLDYVEFYAYDKSPFSEGVAIYIHKRMSRYTPMQVKTSKYSTGRKPCSVKIFIGGEPILLTSVHLNGDELTEVGIGTDIPQIIGGDFNIQPDYMSHYLTWLTTNPLDGDTTYVGFKNENVKAIIDHIVYTPNSIIFPIGKSRPVGSKLHSDHLGVIAEFDIVT